MSQNNKHVSIGILIGVVGSILFSAKAIIIKLSLQLGSDPATLLALRMIFSLPFFWAAYLFQAYKKPQNPLNLKDVLKIIFLGFLGYYFSSYMDFLGLQYLSAGLERIILYLSPTIVVLLSALILKKPIQLKQWLALVITYLGVITVFADDVVMSDQILLGALFVFISAFSYAIYLLLSGELVHRVGSIRLVCYASSTSMVCSLIQALILNPDALMTQSAQVYSLSLINAFFCTFLPMLLVMMSVSRIGSSLSSQAGMIGPVATIFFAWLFLNELPGFIQLIGTCIVLIGIGVLLTIKNPARPSSS